MDERDKSILKCLDRDARMSLTDISKELKIPVTTIKFRIEKLIEDGVIEQFTTLFNPDVLGYQIFAMVTLQTERFLVDEVGRKTVDQLSKMLVDEPCVQFAGVTQDGQVRMLCVFKSVGDLRKFVSDLEAKSAVKKGSFEIFDRVAKGRGIRSAL